MAGQFSRRSQQLVRESNGPARVIGDASQLRSMVAELLSNASKVSPPGTSVTVSCSIEGACVVLRVTDSGPGVPAEDLPYVFKRSYRTAHAGDQALPGTGIGLSLVQHTITTHGGAVSAASTGSGAVFTVRLPATEVTMPPLLSQTPRSPA